MNAHTPSSARWPDRLAGFINRRGVLVALALGAVVLTAGIGSTGLWEPWEMDRADLARTLASPPEVVAAFDKDVATGGARVASPAELALVKAAASEGVLLKLPEAGTPTALRAALDLARTRTVAAIVIDGRLLIPDASRNDLWAQAGKLSAEAIHSAAGASVVVVRGANQPPAAELAKRLAVERWKDVWDSSSTMWSLDAGWDAAGVEAAATAQAATSEDPIIVLEAGDVAGLEAALDAGQGVISTRVAFKDSGSTVALPPLETWLRAAAYRIFGPSEWTTRAPGVVLGLLALWVLLTTVRTVWSPRVAFFAGVVLATLPLFFAQSRIISGEPGMTLALTLVGCGLLLGTLVERSRAGEPRVGAEGVGDALPPARPIVSSRLVWSYLAAGLVTAFFTKGVYGLAVCGLVSVALPLVSGPSKKLADWVPPLAFFAAAGLVELIAHSAPPGSMFSGLDFQTSMFSEGPSVYSRTFDMVIKQLGFGLAPWSPLVIISIGLLTFSSLEKRDKTGLIVIAWFFLPIVVLMASLGVGNQFLFPGTAAAAIAVALMLEKLVRGESGPKFFVAFAVVAMFYIMRRELKVSPEPLVGYLAFDPPFAKEGNLRFPETVEFFWGFKQSMIIAALACLVHFGGFSHFVVRAARWLRNTRPFLITTGIVLLLGSLFGLAVIGSIHGMGMSSRFSSSIQAAQKALVGRLVGQDPLFVVGLATLVLILGVIALRWVFPAAGRALVSALPPLTPKVRRYAWGAAVVLWAGALLAAMTRITLPDDGYWGERLASLPAVTALAGAGLVALMVWVLDRSESAVSLDKDAAPARQRRPWLTPVIAGVAVLPLLLVAQLVRDAQLDSPLVTLLVLLGFAAAAVAFVPRIVARSDVFIFSICALLALIVMSFVVPLVDRAGLVTEIVLPDIVNPKTYGLRSLLQSVWFLGPVLLVFAMLVNFALPKLIGSFPNAGPDYGDRVHAFTDRVAERSGRGKVLVFILVLVALIGVVVHLVKLEPAIAVNVSQKHILDTWHETAGEGAPIYKHGAFSASGRKDDNFYTADMPEFRDRQAALKVLLGRDDQVLEVETATGTETLVFPGWSDKNDQNQDKRRDVLAVRSFATAVGDSVLTDATQKWAPQSLVGKRLGDASGRTWTIVDNDATSVRIGSQERLSFALLPRSRAFYVIDDPRYEIGATAESLERRALLLPADQLSELNYAFRLLSDGRHLPVLDGSSYRVLLTTSWLEPSEPQQNRLALATFDDKTFAAIKDPRLIREWGNFEDTIQVVGYSTDKGTVTTGENLKLSVYYKTLKLVKKSLKIFIHMDKSGGGARIAGDHWPLNPTKHTEENKNCGGCYRTDHWLVGDIVRDDFDIEIPEGNTGEYTIWIGLYQPGPDTRLQVKAFDQKRVKHDGQNRLGLGTIQVK